MSMKQVKQFLVSNGAWVGFFVLVVAMVIATQGDFLSARNLTNLIRQASINGILACGMTMVILIGGIDLSIGSIVALAGVLVGITQVNMGWMNMGLQGALASTGVAILAGAILGALNGGLISWLRIAPFVITLGMMVIGRGLAMILSDGAAISPMSEELNLFSSGYVAMEMTWLLNGAALAALGYLIWKNRSEWSRWILPASVALLFLGSFVMFRGFPYLAIVLGLVFLFFGFVLQRTVFGRSVFALGSNSRAAYWAGVPILKVTFWVYTLMGVLSGLAAALLTSRLNGADPNAGQLFELDAIASVVIGGTSLKGGSGSILGTFAGALTIATLNNGMDLLGVPSFYQMVFKGVIIILAVSIDRTQRQS